MKILLTGAGGFIGSAFARCALHHEHEVGGLFLPAENVPSELFQDSRFRVLRGTLAAPPWDAITEFSAQVCIHTAWITTPGQYLESPANFDFYESSLRFMRGLRERGTSHLIALGTCIEYAPSDQPLSEDRSPIAPATTYARCKDRLRQALQEDVTTHGSTFCWPRIFYPYGPGEHPLRLCSSIIDKLSRGEPLVLRTPESTKDYIYIDDVADALLRVVESRPQGPINIGTGVGVTVRQIAQLIGQELGRPDLISEIHPPEKDPLGFVVSDASRLRGLGWTPGHSIQDGLARLVAHRQRCSGRTSPGS